MHLWNLTRFYLYMASVCAYHFSMKMCISFICGVFFSIGIFSACTLSDPLHGLWKLSVPQQPGKCCHTSPLPIQTIRNSKCTAHLVCCDKSLVFPFGFNAGKYTLPRGGTLWTKCSTLHADCTLRQPSLSSPKPTILHLLVPPLTVHRAPSVAALIPGKTEAFLIPSCNHLTALFEVVTSHTP